MLQTQADTRTDVLLDVEGLRTYFFLRGGILKAVDGVSFALKAHETLAIVGESGCGKSMTALSFLGLGVPEPHPSWGRMLSESAAEYVRVAPWLVIFPGAAISLAVFGTNLLGDALRDILDPRQRD